MAEQVKPKFAMYWAAACGGCEIAVLNIHEGILDVDANFEVVFWPVAMDAKYKDVEAMEDGSITLCLFNGAIRNSENEEMAHLLRRKSQVLVAFGSCACEGCIPGLANFSSLKSLMDTAYGTLTTDPVNGNRPRPEYAAPEGTLHIPVLYETVKTLGQTVAVDYFMPGCPPESRQIAAVVDLVIKALKGEAALPPAGSVIGAGDSTVCDECPRTREEKTISEFKRMATFQPNTTECLLEQGILCAGLATRSGCQARCPTATPTEGVGIVEAPRGTLTLHYWTDERGVVTKANLIVGTTNNYAPISMSVSKAAPSFNTEGTVVSEGLLNRVEMAFRAYDPCFGCATHTLPGPMPLEVTIRGAQSDVVTHLKQT